MFKKKNVQKTANRKCSIIFFPLSNLLLIFYFINDRGTFHFSKFLINFESVIIKYEGERKRKKFLPNSIFF